MRKRVLLTGASGVIGSEIGKLLSNSGYEVYEVHRIKNSYKSKKNVKNIYFDILTDKWEVLESVFPKINYVVHFAATLKLGNSEDEIFEIEKVNIEFTKFLINLSIKYKIERFVFASTLSFIKKPLTKIITEDSEVEPVLYYSKSKLISENDIIKECELNEIDYSILRISSPLSNSINKMHENVVKKWINEAFKNKKFTLIGNGERSQDFVSVMDVSNAVLLSLKSRKSGIYNIASGTTITMKELAELIKNKIESEYFNDFSIEENIDKWNISIQKAKNELKYFPSYTSKELILKILSGIKYEDCNLK